MTAPVQQAIAALGRLQSAFSGELGVAAVPLAGGDALRFQADESFPAASLIKLPLLVAALERVGLGALDLGQRVRLEDDAKVTGSGVLRDLDAGLSLTVRDLLTLMIIVSDNTATNMVIDLVGGVDAVNRTSQRLGLTRTRLVGKLQLPQERQNRTQRAGARSVITPADACRLLELLHTGKAVSADMCKVAGEILARQHYTDSLGRYLPWPADQPLAPWRISSKSGSIQGVRNQAGWITSGEFGYAVAICTKGCRDLRFHVDNEGDRAVAEASRIVYRWVHMA